MHFKFNSLIVLGLLSGAMLQAKIKHLKHTKNSRNSSFCQVIAATELLSNFNTLVILGEIDNQMNWQCNGKPKIVLTKEVNVELKKLFNIEMLFVVQIMPGANLDYFAKLLKQMRGKRIIINLKAVELNAIDTQRELKRIFHYCWSRYILNVIVLLKDLEYTKNYYSYRPFPVLEIEQHNLIFSNVTLFPNRMLNLHGYPLRTYPDQLQPRTLLYYNSRGNLKMIGYIGRLLETFAQKLNAKLIFALPVRLGTSYFYTKLIQLTRNGTLDIPASIACINEHATDLENFSNVIEIGALFPMVPVAAAQAQSEIYALLFQTKLAGIFLGLYLCFATMQSLNALVMTGQATRDIYMQLLLSEHALLGIIGSTFRRQRCHSKFIFILLCFTGQLFNTIFNTFLSSFIIYPPSAMELNSFDDMLQRNVTILDSANGASLLPMYAGSQFLAKYRSLFYVMDNLTAFVERRRSLDPRLAYVITSSLWEVHEKRQRYFAHKLYRKSPNMFFNNFMLYALPLPENSIFEEPLNVYIFQLHASGIFEYWYRLSFSDMIKVGLMSFKDLSTPRSFSAAIVEDLYWIWLFYIAGVAISWLVFAGECILGKVHKIGKNTFVK